MIRLYCAAGFKFVGTNEVVAFIGKRNVSRALAELCNAVMATLPREYEDSPQFQVTGDGKAFIIPGAESFTIQDLASTVFGFIDGLAVDVQGCEGKPPPEEVIR